MCGIAGIQLHDDALFADLGRMMSGMLCQAAQRGPDSAGVGLYGDPRYSPPGHSVVSLLGAPANAYDLLAAGWTAPLPPPAVVTVGSTVVVNAVVALDELLAAVHTALPDATVIGQGHDLAVLKGTGDPVRLTDDFELADAQGWQGIAHTRMATESAVTSAHSHPFSVAPDLCLVHNGSFANHATIRRQLQADGHVFDSDNDSEVAARYLAHHLAAGDDLDKALRRLCQDFDGFYTLLVTTAEEFAVVRDAIACKPAVVAETGGWIAMASEYRSLAALPGVDKARLFEPEPEEVYLWAR